MALEYAVRDTAGPGKWTLVADAATGEVLHVESDVHFDITGSVQARVIVGPESAECGQTGVSPLTAARVTSPVGNAFTDSTGMFAIPYSGSASVEVTSELSGGHFVVSTEAGSQVSSTLSVTPPGPANFLHQDDATPPEYVLAQLNAYKQVSEIRDMLLSYVPQYPVIATQADFLVNVNRTGPTCEQSGGAWYDDDSSIRSVNFCQRADERTNTAFGSIVHHEYAHHIIDSGGSGQSEYGEGMADSIAMLFAKDPRIGLGYHLGQCDTPLRHADSDCQYSDTECSSCGSGLYECGALLSGTIWDVWQQLQITEPANADDLIRSLVLSSIPLHSGTSIDASIAVDLLTLDDDDGLIENGTPHYTEICGGFAAHGMDCPAIVDGLVVQGSELDAEGPSDGPFAPSSISYTLHNLGPEAMLQYTVNVDTGSAGQWLTVDSPSGSIALGEQVTITASIDQAAAALLADGDYSATLSFENSSSGVGNVSRQAQLRVGAPVPVYTASFDAGPEGFVADTEPGNLWHHSTTCVDSLPGHTVGGSLYYGKDSVCNYTAPTPILHTITSPVIPLASTLLAELGFNYTLSTENDPNYDHADVLLSVDGGPFQIVASNNNGGAKLNETNGWQALRFDIAGLLPASGPTNVRIQLAFNAVDPNSNTKTGFAVDDITLYAKAATCATDQECDDGMFCNGVEICADQACVPGTPVTCDDGDSCTDDLCDDSSGCHYPDNGSCGASGAFVEVGGLVVMEAESFSQNIARGAHGWVFTPSGQASGQVVMAAFPNAGSTINVGYSTTSPELSYPVQFSTPGVYTVWVRGRGATANDDSCHVGIDAQQLSSADRITGFGSNPTWSRSTMDGPLATIHVSGPGVRNINLWMREDGFFVDKLVLTTNPSFVPSGSGPAESARAGSGPCAAYCSNPTLFGTSNYQSGNLGTGATCHQTTAILNGGVCGNFTSPRQLLVNGMPMACNWSPWSALPPKVNGGYCIQTTSGNYAWAAFTTW